MSSQLTTTSALIDARMRPSTESAPGSQRTVRVGRVVQPADSAHGSHRHDLRGASLGKEADLRDVDLTGATRGRDLSEATHRRLEGCVLTGADVNATLFDADELTSAMANATVGIRSGETLSGADLSA